MERVELLRFWRAFEKFREAEGRMREERDDGKGFWVDLGSSPDMNVPPGTAWDC